MDNEVVIVVRTEDQTDFKSIRKKAVKESETTGRDSSNGFAKSFRTSFTSMAGSLFSGIATNATGIFSRTFGTATSSNPYIGAGIAAAILASVATAAPIAGGILGGGIVTGLGAGLAGLGLVFAAKNEEVRKQWKSLTDDMGRELTEAAQPFVPVLLTGIERVRRVLKTSLGPAISEVFSDSAPAIDGFFAALEVAFRDKSVVQAVRDISDAFIALLGALSPVAVDTIIQLSEEISELAKTVGENPDFFASIIGGIGNLIAGVIQLITWLYSLGAWFDDNPYITKPLLIALGLVVGSIASTIAMIDLLKGAWNGVKDLKSKASIDIGGFTSGVRTAIGIGFGFAARVFRATLNGSSNPFLRVIGAALGAGRGFAARVFRAALTANWGGVVGALGSALSLGRQWAGRVFTATFNVRRVVTSVIKGIIPGFAKGGIRGAAGGGLQSNETLVGEAGPEIVNLPPGARVFPNGRTRQRMNNQGMNNNSGEQKIVLEFRSGGSTLEDLFVEVMRKGVKVRGGNAQRVLGTG